jgi:hypothetical protein
MSKIAVSMDQESKHDLAWSLGLSSYSAVVKVLTRAGVFLRLSCEMIYLKITELWAGFIFLLTVVGWKLPSVPSLVDFFSKEFYSIRGSMGKFTEPTSKIEAIITRV